MANMSARKRFTEKEIDEVVVAQADDDLAWEEAVQVPRDREAAISIPAELAMRAAFLARLHRKSSVEEWVTHVIQERIELEEAAFAGAKRELARGE
jgi:hypothetical protein